MKTIFQIITVLSIISYSSCFYYDGQGPFDCVDGNRTIVTEEFDLNDFSSITLNIAADIKLTQGDRQFVEVEGQENIVDILNMKVRNHILEIDFDDCVNYDDLTIFITIPDIEFLSIRGSGNIVGENIFDLKDLELKISGSGDMDLGIDADDVKAKISGSGKIKMDGKMDVLDLRISGSGDLEAFDLNTNDSKISISGSGDVEIFAEDNLDVKITGSGDVYYKGHPKLDVNITGSGKVVDAN